MSTDQLSPRCVISGGGPAGIMLGFLLARKGIDVVVLEKWPDFFRDFRGDTIHPSTMEVLYELGLLKEFLALPHSEMRQMAAHIGGEEVVVADLSLLSTRCPFIAFIPQWDFLNFISDKAKAFPNFHLMMETEAVGLIEENGSVLGVHAKNKDGEFDIRAELVVGADGRHSTIREATKLPVEEFGAPIDVLWFRLPRDVSSTPDQSFGYINDGKLLILLDRNDYWQCGFIIGKGDFDGIKERGLEAFQKSIAGVAPFLGKATQELNDWDKIKLLSVTVDHLTTWYRKGVLCIGDAAHAMSPVGGVGINLAVQDAVAAANVLVPAFKRGIPTVSNLAAIQKRRTFPARMTQRMQVFIHRHAVQPILASKGDLKVPFVIKLLKWFPFLRWIPARIIGIGFRPEHIEV